MKSGHRPKHGRPPVVDEIEIILATLEPPPERLRVTHWSSRLLDAELQIPSLWIDKIKRQWRLQP